MLGTQYLGSGAPSHTLLDDEAASIKVALRADPDTISDHAPAVKSPLNNGLLTDENTISDLDCFGIYERHVIAYICASAELLEECPKANSPHYDINRACPAGMVREGLQQLLATELLPQMRGHIHFELRI